MLCGVCSLSDSHLTHFCLWFSVLTYLKVLGTPLPKSSVSCAWNGIHKFCFPYHYNCKTQLEKLLVLVCICGVVVPWSRIPWPFGEGNQLDTKSAFLMVILRKKFTGSNFLGGFITCKLRWSITNLSILFLDPIFYHFCWFLTGFTILILLLHHNQTWHETGSWLNQLLQSVLNHIDFKLWEQFCDYTCILYQENLNVLVLKLHQEVLSLSVIKICMKLELVFNNLLSDNIF